MKSKSPRITAALEALDRASMRKTPQRVAIVRAFVDDPSHPTAQQIFDRLRRQMPTMSFATVYNTLAALEHAGSCRTLRIDGPAGDAGTRFDPNVEPHDHAVCDRCGSVSDIPRASRDRTENETPPDLESAPSVKGFHVTAVERLYRGECAQCKGKESVRS
ncbi:MAG: Fur family transcriptional regulator [Polyangiales bacterium]